MSSALAPLDAPDLDRPALRAHYDMPQVGAALDAIERASGGRQSLVAALTAGADTDDDGLSYVIRLIADPRMDARSLRDICRAGRVSMGELIEAYKRGVYAAMQVQVMATIATQTPAVVKDVFDRSVAHYVPCEACSATGTITSLSKPDDPPKPCTACGATGQQLVQPTLDRQKVALELSGVLGKKGPLVSITQRAVNVSDSSAAGFSKLIAATDKLLYGRGMSVQAPTETWDAEVTAAPDAPGSTSLETGAPQP